MRSVPAECHPIKKKKKKKADVRWQPGPWQGKNCALRCVVFPPLARAARSDARIHTRSALPGRRRRAREPGGTKTPLPPIGAEEGRRAGEDAQRRKGALEDTDTPDGAGPSAFPQYPQLPESPELLPRSPDRTAGAFPRSPLRTLSSPSESSPSGPNSFFLSRDRGETGKAVALFPATPQGPLLLARVALPKADSAKRNILTR